MTSTKFRYQSRYRLGVVHTCNATPLGHAGDGRAAAKRSFEGLRKQLG